MVLCLGGLEVGEVSVQASYLLGMVQ
jgi:hypothetical protein